MGWDKSKKIGEKDDFGDFDYAYGSTKELSDGSFVLVGYATSCPMPPSFPDDAFIAKLDERGEAECPTGITDQQANFISEDLEFDVIAGPDFDLLDISFDVLRDHDFKDLSPRSFSENPCGSAGTP